MGCHLLSGNCCEKRSNHNLASKLKRFLPHTRHPTQQYECDSGLVFKFTWWLHIFLNNTSSIYGLFLLWETQQKNDSLASGESRGGGDVCVHVGPWQETIRNQYRRVLLNSEMPWLKAFRLWKLDPIAKRLGTCSKRKKAILQKKSSQLTSFSCALSGFGKATKDKTKQFWKNRWAWY